MSVPELSVVTVTRGRRDLLLRKAESLRRQTLTAGRFEWRVLANDAPESAEALRALDLPFTLWMEEAADAMPVAAARNRAAAGARGEILLMSDDDCLLPPGCLEAHLAVHRRRPRAMVVGPLRLPDELRRGGRLEPFERVGAVAGRGLWINATGANTSFPRDAFERVGGYDESFREYGGEDPELALRLRALGLEVRVAPAATALHAGRQLGPEGVRKAFLAGRAHARVHRRHPRLEVGVLLGVHPALVALKRLALAGPLARLLDPDRVAYERAYLQGILDERRNPS